MARQKQYPKTIQCWPGGESLEYRGDIDGPPNQRSLRSRVRGREAKSPAWRKGTPEEWRKIRIEVSAEMYGERDILGCDSALVTDLLQTSCGGDLGEAFDYDALRNLYADPSDWDVKRCEDYIEENGLAFPEDVEEQSDLDVLREICREHAQENPAEVYEWWRVSSWLCDQLHAIGEVTIDNGYGHWWGRQGTGQQWIMDGTLQKVAAQFEREGE